MTLHLVPTAGPPRGAPFVSRRTLISATAGITIGRLLLPPNVRADGEPRQVPGIRGSARAELEAMARIDLATAGMLAWWDDATQAQRRVFIALLARVDGGMPLAQAAALARAEGLA